MFVDGFRHEAGSDMDWPDTVRVDGDLNPGFADGLTMPVASARRLAAAITKACDLLEGIR